MRRAVGVYERLIRRFTAQDTDYQLLLSTFAEGLYTEMDFRNEALNMERMTMLMQQSEFGSRDVVIPKPIMETTTRSAKLTHVPTYPRSLHPSLCQEKIISCIASVLRPWSPSCCVCLSTLLVAELSCAFQRVKPSSHSTACSAASSLTKQVP